MITTEKKDGYVENKAIGELTVLAIVEYVQKNQETWSSDNVLWNFSEANLNHNIPNYDLMKARMAKITKIIKSRTGFKTAYLVADDITIAIAEMAVSVGRSIDEKIQHAVFKDREEAIAWLKSSKRT